MKFWTGVYAVMCGNLGECGDGVYIWDRCEFWGPVKLTLDSSFQTVRESISVVVSH